MFLPSFEHILKSNSRKYQRLWNSGEYLDKRIWVRLLDRRPRIGERVLSIKELEFPIAFVYMGPARDGEVRWGCETKTIYWWREKGQDLTEHYNCRPGLFEDYKEILEYAHKVGEQNIQRWS